MVKLYLLFLLLIPSYTLALDISTYDERVRPKFTNEQYEEKRKPNYILRESGELVDKYDAGIPGYVRIVVAEKLRDRLINALKNSADFEDIKLIIKQMRKGRYVYENQGTPYHTVAHYSNNVKLFGSLNSILPKGFVYTSEDVFGLTPLHYASMFDNTEIIRFLIDHGCNVNAKDKFGRTPLHYSAKASSSPEIIDLFVKEGADINNRENSGITMLMEASAVNQNPKIILKLLSLGADVNFETTNGNTAILYSLGNPNIEILKTLANNGGEINHSVKCDTEHISYLHILAAFPNLYNDKLLKALIELGVDIETKDSKGLTALDYARLINNSKMVTALIKVGADTSIR